MEETRTVGRIQWGALAFGALLCVAVQLALSLLGSGLGLSALALERGENPGTGGWIAGAAFGVITIFGSLFLGGFLAARLASQPGLRRGIAFLHGVGVWAVVTLSFALLVGSQASSALGALLSKAGIGAGSAVTASAVVEQLKELNPRVVSDLKLMKGKIVSQVVTNGQTGGIADELEEASREAERKSKRETRKEIRQMGGEVRETAAKASLAAFGALILGAASAGVGGVAGRRKRQA